MKKIVELNIDNSIAESQNGWLTILNKENSIISNLKCFKNAEEINILDVRNIHLYKLHKSIFINMGKLQILDLRDNKLMKVSKSIFYLRNLKVLRLDNNRLEYLPIEIGKLDNLETLTLNYNNLTKLPSTIKELLNLKVLKLSYNKINRLDVDLGHLKSLETLHIDSNHFSEIPTTIYHLKHLCDFSLEWLEFLDPPFQKLVKDNIGQTIISLIKMSLLDLLKDNQLYCDFITFVEKNSTKKNLNTDLVNSVNEDNNNESSKKLVSPIKEPCINFVPPITSSNEGIKSCGVTSNKETISNMNTITDLNKDGNMVISYKNLQKLFLTVENNYFGVLKSLLDHSVNYLKLKNNENKNVLYLAIHNHRNDIVDFILNKINITTLTSPHIYLHKSIKMRDPLLTTKMLLHIDPNYCDDEGNNAFHILFSSFYKNHTKCSLIGDKLLEYNCKPNFFNDNLMSPIHMAIKKGSRESLEWILMQNRNLLKEGKEVFDINIKGKNGITCLHMAVSLNKVEEMLLLLENGADVFSKTVDKKSALNLHKGNFFIGKILRNQESQIMENKYYQKLNHLVLNLHNNYTTIEEVSNIEDLTSLKKTIIYNTIQTDKDYSKINSPILYKFNSNLPNNKMNEEISRESRNFIEQEDQGSSPIKISEKLSSNQKILSNSPSFNKKPRNTVKYETPKFKSNQYSLSQNLVKENFKLSKGSTQNYFRTSEKKSFRKQTYQNISNYKDIILNPASSLAEKYDSLMNIKLIFNRKEIENVFKIIIEGLNLDKDMDELIFMDICKFLVTWKLVGFTDLINNKIKSFKLKRTTLMEINNTIILLNFNDMKNTHRLKSFSNKGIKTLLKTNDSPSKLFNEQVVFKIPNLNLAESYNSENSLISLKEKEEDNNIPSRNDTKKSKPKNKQKTQMNGDNHTFDEYNHEVMNEINKNNLDLKLNSQNLPKKLLKEINQKSNDVSCESQIQMMNSDSSRKKVNVLNRNYMVSSHKEKLIKQSSTLYASKFYNKNK